MRSARRLRVSTNNSPPPAPPFAGARQKPFSYFAVFDLVPQTPGASHPARLASSHKLGRPFGLASRWSRSGFRPVATWLGFRRTVATVSRQPDADRRKQARTRVGRLGRSQGGRMPAARRLRVPANNSPPPAPPFAGARHKPFSYFAVFCFVR